MTIRPFSHELIEIKPSGVTLETSLSCPADDHAEILAHHDGQFEPKRKVAVCLHPWSWLGGRMDDPVLHTVEDQLLKSGYYVLRYNSRGVGRSSGWPSFTGTREAEDLRELVHWALSQIPSIESVLIVGYSYGSLIASSFPLLDQIKTSHIILSYPLGPRSWLTAFNGKLYTAALNSLLHEPRSNVLIIYGDQDDFTGVGSYDSWADALRKEVQGEGRGTLEIAKVKGATHFWRDDSSRKLVRVIQNWLQ